MSQCVKSEGLPLSRVTQTGSTNQSDEILATSSDFVPTALRSECCGATEAEAGELEPPSAGTRDGGPDQVDWQTAIKRAIRDSAQLREVLRLPADGDSARKLKGERSFPTFVPWEYLRRIQPGDPHDPLLRQVLPVSQEDQQHPGFSGDPVGDLDSVVAGGLLHKYSGRALMITTGACGIHCRYCFRREFPYTHKGSRSDPWRPALNYLRQRREIDEVLLSGGDPLTLVDQTLDSLLSSIEAVQHVRRVRIHTRMPIVIPQRITERLVDRLCSSRLAVWMVVHVNHPHELDANVLARLAMLVDRGIPVLNQAVLLRGVNDDADTLVQLCRDLVNHRIQPYYLHQLDRVAGAAHFEVSIREGERLMQQLRESLPGYAVPQYVVEQAGRKSKTPLPERS